MAIPLFTASADGSISVTVSCQIDDSGFVVARQTISVAPGLSEAYGYVDAFNGTKVSQLDAIVAAHMLVFGDDKNVINAKLAVISGSGFVTNFMGDGEGNVVSYVNGVNPGVASTNVEIFDGDLVEIFATQDTYMWSDTQTWFEYEGNQIEALTVAVDEAFTLTVAGIFCVIWGPPNTMPLDGIKDVGIVPVTVTGIAGHFGVPIKITDEDGEATLSFAAPGTYILSAVDVDSMFAPFMSPWLEVTVLAEKEPPIKTAWWENLHWILQWILRYLFFGWIWMAI